MDVSLLKSMSCKSGAVIGAACPNVGLKRHDENEGLVMLIRRTVCASQSGSSFLAIRDRTRNGAPSSRGEETLLRVVAGGTAGDENFRQLQHRRGIVSTVNFSAAWN